MTTRKRKRSSHRWVDPHKIRPLHPVDRPEALAELTESMLSNGWAGRELLVIECDSGLLQAWTGCHRIQAARDAGLPAVPCYIVPEWKLDEVEAEPSLGHCMDFQRLAILRKTKDKPAIDLMDEEARSNNRM